MRTDTFTLNGHGGTLFCHRWSPEGEPTHVVLLAHGYGEHLGRYQWVAQQLTDTGAVVYGPDHVGHGRSEGERVLVDDIDDVVADLHLVADRAAQEHPGLPVVLLGHSMGGLIAARYAQLHGDDLTAVVLSAPVLGRWAAVQGLLGADVLPNDPIDPATLSRDEAVGQAYVDDPLVWHGGFKRPTLQALDTELRRVSDAGPVDLPILWLHGDADPLVPIDGTRIGWENLRGANAENTTYPGARHEILNETNREQVMADIQQFFGAHLDGA